MPRAKRPSRKDSHWPIRVVPTQETKVEAKDVAPTQETKVEVKDVAPKQETKLEIKETGLSLVFTRQEEDTPENHQALLDQAKKQKSPIIQFCTDAKGKPRQLHIYGRQADGHWTHGKLNVAQLDKDEIRHIERNLAQNNTLLPYAKLEKTPLMKTLQRGHSFIQIQETYHAGYKHAAILKDTREEHYAELIRGLAGAKDKGLSSLVQFETIEECMDFARRLRGNDMFDIQFLDNKPADPAQHDTRLSLEEIINNADNSGMITLATAAGGRAVNFISVDLCLLTKPTLERVFIQNKDRVARGGERGIVHEIYCEKDLDDQARAELIEEEHLKHLSVKERKELGIPRKTLDEILQRMRDRMQSRDLQSIKDQDELREVKANIQQEENAYISENPDKEEKLRSDFNNFFHSVHQERDIEVVKAKHQEHKRSNRHE